MRKLGEWSNYEVLQTVWHVQLLPGDSFLCRLLLCLLLQLLCLAIGDTVPYRCHWPPKPNLTINGVYHCPTGNKVHKEALKPTQVCRGASRARDWRAGGCTGREGIAAGYKRVWSCWDWGATFEWVGVCKLVLCVVFYRLATLL